jgi:hypothetical protein
MDTELPAAVGDEKEGSTAAWTAQPLWCGKERALYSAAGTPVKRCVGC